MTLFLFCVSFHWASLGTLFQFPSHVQVQCDEVLEFADDFHVCFIVVIHCIVIEANVEDVLYTCL